MADSEHKLLLLSGSKHDGEFVEKDKKRNTVICKMCKKVCMYTGSTTIQLFIFETNTQKNMHAAMLERQQNSEGLKVSSMKSGSAACTETI